jgi:hypothetical protein
MAMAMAMVVLEISGSYEGEGRGVVEQQQSDRALAPRVNFTASSCSTIDLRSEKVALL